ncbi:hypothetical protein O7606_22715 [Micromonospora sp. WMMD882]|uniref:hypothetical protein n=1 Tax=Micromonospora sp. WMMD882 TaxID=3015151 RepID=UPI00248B2C53|nr:hypothetical protein [Micromonospora sp. WMMD882]WBB78975.1 hypothetical protein O7606_22715 [Micromonospora sp. WMMD882]
MSRDAGPPPDHRYLVQLPVTAADLDVAARVARVVARSLGFHHLVECDDATVAAVEDPAVRHAAFCPRRLPNGRRCLLRPGHDGPCARRLPR